MTLKYSSMAKEKAAMQAMHASGHLSGKHQKVVVNGKTVKVEHKDHNVSKGHKPSHTEGSN